MNIQGNIDTHRVVSVPKVVAPCPLDFQPVWDV